MWQVPNGWVFDGTSQGTQSKFLLSNHTVAQPEIIIYDRKPPSLVNGAYGVATHRTRYIRGLVDTDGNPAAQRYVIDMSIRWPLNAVLTLSNFNSGFANFRNAGGTGVTPGTHFAADVYTSLFLPTEVAAS